jgi:hypothetical protein
VRQGALLFTERLSYPKSRPSSIQPAYNGANGMSSPPASSTTIDGLVRLLGSAEELAKLGPGLTISASIPATPAGPASPGLAAGLAAEGFGAIARAAHDAPCAALVRAAAALRAQDLPASFLYAFDEPWAIGERMRARIEAMLGRPYLLVEDVWAWHVPPGSGGWAPHRGIADVRLDRDVPEILNVWIALSDVPADRACMHAVPLDEDPGYPDSLAELDAPLASVRALPASAGDALFWNANVLHWGGRSSERANGARVSCSFSLCRADAVERFPALRQLAPLTTLDLGARMGALARMIRIYGPSQPDVSDAVRAWANLTHELSTRFGGGSQRSASVRKAP